MRLNPLHTCALIACLMLASCAHSPPPVIERTKPLPAVLLTQCPALPVPSDNSCDAAALHIKELYDAYGVCAGRLAELIKAND